jgi:hypothetical protein
MAMAPIGKKHYDCQANGGEMSYFKDSDSFSDSCLFSDPGKNRSALPGGARKGFPLNAHKVLTAHFTRVT